MQVFDYIYVILYINDNIMIIFNETNREAKKIYRGICN